MNRREWNRLLDKIADEIEVMTRMLDDWHFWALLCVIIILAAEC